jgi:hypothetical protein
MTTWRRFFVLLAGTALGVTAFLFLFVAVVDPFDTLPLSPPLDRAPIATNARFSFPALARRQRFDSAVIGTSTSRLLRPAALNAAFDARFVNLAMNAATAYEQTRILGVFLDAHPAPRLVIVGLDDIWCLTRRLERYTPRPFPEWMYGRNRWSGYLHLLNLDAVQQAGIQFVTLLGLKPEVYGRDGYTSFVPDDRLYDRARVAAHLAQAAASMPNGDASVPPAKLPFPALDLLRETLAAIPAETTKILFLAPFNHVQRPDSGPLHAEWQECKRRVTALAAAAPNAMAVDFMIPSRITDDDDNYWDSVHYRVGIADRLVRDLARAASGEPSPDGDYVLLEPLRKPQAAR